MKALSVLQPWTHLIVHGYQDVLDPNLAVKFKDIENRSRPTRIRGRVAIAASARLAGGEFMAAGGHCLTTPALRHVVIPAPASVAFGAVLGTVEIVDCVTASDSPWFSGPYGYVLRDPLAFPKPIPCKGALGFWNWEPPPERPGTTPRALTLEQWRAEGVERFGPDEWNWRFICPCCGHIATPRDWKDAGAPESAVAYSCVGRWAGAKREAIDGFGPGPCNYAGGGLFRLGPITISGRTGTYFDFAPVEVPGA
jgi:hypothetical protein